MNHIHCSHFQICSGCTLDEEVNRPPILMEAQQFFLQQGKELQIHSGKAIGWRCRAKLAVRGTSVNPQIGLFRERSHDVVSIPFCRVHHPRINEAVELIRQLLIEEQITPYNEQTFQGHLRYLQLVVERKSGKVQLTLVVNSDGELVLNAPWVKKLWEKGAGLWHSLWINCNTLRTNTIFGHDWFLYRGERFAEERFDNRSVFFHPASFAQANLDLFEMMIKQIKTSISSGNRLVEYYAGVGAIGLCLVDQFRQVSCCEMNPFAKRCFEESIHHLSDEQAAKLNFVEGMTERHLHLLDQSDLVIVDPPRKGLDANTLKAICQSSAKELVYVSCGWPSFQRDCLQLLSAEWQITKIQGFMLFPGSNHLETLAIFRK